MTNSSKNQDTHQSLILSGLELFGEYGVNGTSTRMLAKHSGANVAAISYHFGSKEGLYHEVINYISEQANEHIKDSYLEIAPLLEKESLSKTEAKKIVKRLAHAMLDMILSSNEPLLWARIIVREQTKPTDAFDLIYDALIKNKQSAMTYAIASYLGIDKDSVEAKIRAHTIIGQVLVFITDKECLLRSLETKELSKDHIVTIKEVLDTQIDSCLNSKAIEEVK